MFFPFAIEQARPDCGLKPSGFLISTRGDKHKRLTSIVALAGWFLHISCSPLPCTDLNTPSFSSSSLISSWVKDGASVTTSQKTRREAARRSRSNLTVWYSLFLETALLRSLQSKATSSSSFSFSQMSS